MHNGSLVPHLSVLTLSGARDDPEGAMMLGGVGSLKVHGTFPLEESRRVNFIQMGWRGGWAGTVLGPICHNLD